MQCLQVSGAVRQLQWSLGVKGLKKLCLCVFVNVWSPERQPWSHVITRDALNRRHSHTSTPHVTGTATEIKASSIQFATYKLPTPSLGVTALQYRTVALCALLRGWSHAFHSHAGKLYELYQQHQPTTQSEHKLTEPIPVAARTKVWVRCCSLAGIEGSYPAGWHGCLPIVSVECCHVEVCASSWSLVQRSPTDCGVSECDRESPIMRKPWLLRHGTEITEQTAWERRCHYNEKARDWRCTQSACL